jgi:ElaB/YqjD/DUF883 family membrane-anchored ribosome-binding protein
MAENKNVSNPPDDTQSAEEAPSHDDSTPADQANDRIRALRQELLEAIGDLRAEVARLQMDEARGRLRQWIRDNPTLAVFLAAGTGIAAGRLLSKALEPSPPAPLSKRARQRAQELAHQARERAQRMGDDVSKQVSDARDRADRTRRDASDRAAAASDRLRRQAQDWSATVAERAASLRDLAADQARHLGASLEQEAEEVSTAVADRARGASDAIKSSAQRVSDTADTVRSGYKAAKIGTKVAKFVFALFVAKKSTDWLRKLL